MTSWQKEDSSFQKPLRLWPGVAAVTIQWLMRYVIPVFFPETLFYGVMGALACGVLVVIWWLFFSRAPWSERIGGILFMAIAIFVTRRFLIDKSIAGGMMGMMFFIYVIPILSLAFVLWAIISRKLSIGARWVSMAAAILIACATLTLIRTEGMTGEAGSDFKWRWSKSYEEVFMAQGPKEPEPTPPQIVEPQQQVPAPQTAEKATEIPAAPQSAVTGKPPVSQTETPVAALQEAPLSSELPVWPGFRGLERDGIVRGSDQRIKTDWSASPPVELWRKPIGPGWSSFAVNGDHVYTQEQRGEEEVVACYNISSGDPIWIHKDAARFWESNAGAGPRGTPTLSNGRVYALGATGILNVLNASTGATVWSRNASTDTGSKVPGWGFSSSPLIIDNLVVVATAGSIVAYDINTGKPRWFGPKNRSGYSSPHYLKIHGVPQILLMSSSGISSFAPADGKLLWEFKLSSNAPIVQPAVWENDNILVSDGDGNSMRRLALENGSGKWTVKERWTTTGLKPYFNDFVAHKGNAYGFDGSYLSCINLENGERKWKGGKYGHGQLILLPDQDVLLILSEQGDLAMVAATSDQFKELGHLPGIKGKTWNHPALARDVLLVRNGQEMAAFKLPIAQD